MNITHFMCNQAASEWASYKGQLCRASILLINRDLFTCALDSSTLTVLYKKEQFQS